MLSDQKRRALCAEVARLLRVERLKKGISMTRLAEQAGLSQQMISYVERGMRNPTLDVLLRVSEALDIRFDSIMERAYEITKKGAKKGNKIGRAIRPR
jgi:transcriptional regulator with XRE-family HTH domain